MDVRSQTCKIVLFVAIVSCGPLNTVFPAIIQVAPGESIQQAVDVSVDGDTVLVSEGVYIGTVVLHGKTVTLGSQFLMDGSPTHIEATTISPDSQQADTQSCVVYAYGEQLGSRLVGLRLNGGAGTRWTETGAMAGGAVHICSSAVAIEHCLIENGSSSSGGGIGLLRRLNPVPVSSLELIACTIRNCSSPDWGGGLYAITANASLFGCTFQNNQADQGGGGLDLVGGCSITVDSCAFLGNIGSVGGLSIGNGSGYVRYCLFDGNGCVSNPNLADASHLHAEGNSLTISGNTFQDNTQGFVGVLLYHFGQQFAPSHFYGNVLQYNVTTELTGTLVLAGCNGEIGYNLFRGNSNVAGGAIYAVDGGGPRIHHNWFEGNSSGIDTIGSVLSIVNRAAPLLDSNAVAGNLGQTISIWQYPGWQPSISAENNWWGDSTGPFSPTSNPGGTGDTLLEDSVHFIPWLTDPPDTSWPQRADQWPLPVTSNWKLLAVYPNPFNQSIRIIITGFSHDRVDITLYDLLGREAARIHYGPLVGGEISYEASDHLATGIYFLCLRDQSSVQVRKVVYLK